MRREKYLERMANFKLFYLQIILFHSIVYTSKIVERKFKYVTVFACILNILGKWFTRRSQLQPVLPEWEYFSRTAVKETPEHILIFIGFQLTGVVHKHALCQTCAWEIPHMSMDWKLEYMYEGACAFSCILSPLSRMGVRIHKNCNIGYNTYQLIYMLGELVYQLMCRVGGWGYTIIFWRIIELQETIYMSYVRNRLHF